MAPARKAGEAQRAATSAGARARARLRGRRARGRPRARARPDAVVGGRRRDLQVAAAAGTRRRRPRARRTRRSASTAPRRRGRPRAPRSSPQRVAHARRARTTSRCRSRRCGRSGPRPQTVGLEQDDARLGLQLACSVPGGPEAGEAAAERRRTSASRSPSSGGRRRRPRRPPRASSRVGCASSADLQQVLRRQRPVCRRRSASRRLAPMADSARTRPPTSTPCSPTPSATPAASRSPATRAALGADPAMRELVGEAGLRNDIPSVTEGVDIGPEPTPFQQAQLLAAEAWGAKRTWFLINGASQGNHATCMALAHYGEPRRRPAQRPLLGDRRAGAQRDAADLRRPGARPRAGHRPRADARSRSPRRSTRPPTRSRRWSSPPPTSAPAPTSPALAEVAHERGLPLIVDEAWGAHLHFHPDLPPDALSVRRRPGHLLDPQDRRQPHPGGDAAPRRTAAASTRRSSTAASAWSKRPAPAACSPAPSTPPAARPRSTAKSCSARRWQAIAETRDAIEEIPGLAVLDESMVGRPGVAGWDPLRLSIDVRGTGSTGYRLAKTAFYERGIDLELYSENVVVAIFGVGEPAAAGRRAAGRGAARRGRRARGRARRRRRRSWRRRRPGASW